MAKLILNWDELAHEAAKPLSPLEKEQYASNVSASMREKELTDAAKVWQQARELWLVGALRKIVPKNMKKKIGDTRYLEEVANYLDENGFRLEDHLVDGVTILKRGTEEISRFQMNFKCTTKA